MAKKPVGRPPKLLADGRTIKQIEGLGSIMCTTKEAAAALDVSEPTFLKFLDDHPDARAAFDCGKGKGLMSLRRKQWKLADTNAAMAIFLGKNYLGQADRQELTGKDGEPLPAPSVAVYQLPDNGRG